MIFVFVVLIISALLGIGYVTVTREINSMLSVKNYFNDFLSRYEEFAFTDDGNTQENYDWLLTRVDRIQRYLGQAGLVLYKPPFANYAIDNYRVVTELINQLGTTLRPHKDDLLTVRNLLVRYIGNLDQLVIEKRRDAKNPFLLFRLGIQYIISIPVALLNWIGLIDYSNVTNFRNNSFVRIVSGLIALVITSIGLIDAILNIYNNWEIITNFLSSLWAGTP